MIDLIHVVYTAGSVCAVYFITVLSAISFWFIVSYSSVLPYTSSPILNFAVPSVQCCLGLHLVSSVLMGNGFGTLSCGWTVVVIGLSATSIFASFWFLLRSFFDSTRFSSLGLIVSLSIVYILLSP